MENFDYQSQFERVKKDVAKAFTKALDVQADQTGLRLQAKNVWVDDTSESGDWQAQHEAVRKDKTWGVPVYADVELTDRKTGKVVATQNKIKIASLPKPTDFGSFIVDGKHYQVHNQLRRKPGVYITEMKNGEAKTEINIAGRPFDIKFDPEASTFRLMRGPLDTTGVALYPVLSRLGISDKTLTKAWSENVFAANKAVSEKDSSTAVIKVAKHFHAGEEFDSPDAAASAIASYLDETELRPEVTSKTLGKPFTKVTPEALLLGTTELLKNIAGKRPPDDRHALEFKKALALADIMKERFLKPNGELSVPLDAFRRKILRKMNNQRRPPNKVNQIVSAGQFTPAINTFFTQSALSNLPDQTNPLHMLNGMTKITILGEGGVADAEKVRAEERSVHPSQMGFIDPIHTPDSSHIGTVMNLPIGVSKHGDDLETVVYDTHTKKNRRMTPSEAGALTVGFPDQFEDGKPLGKKVKALVRGDIHMVDADQVDVVLRTPRQAFSISSNTIPFLASTGGVRAQMATKMLEQAIPLHHREAPLVQVKLGAGTSTIEDAIGSGFSIKALDDGVVKAVTKRKITVTTKDGEIEHPIYSNMPLNNKAFLDATPRVAVGDTVKQGAVLADSNFTDNGTLALGTNLKAAYIPWKGYNFEDGIVISENGARKLTSTHMHQYATESDKNAELSLDKFVAFNQIKIDAAQQAKMDKDGVVKVGTVLRKGDPLWVGVKENKTAPDYLVMKKLSKTFSAKRAYMEPWSEDVEGQVVDVVRNGKGVKVYVKTLEPAVIGDKLTNRVGAKGIITKIIPDNEAPYTVAVDGSHEPVDILLNPHTIVSRINPSQVMETAAAKLAIKTGKPYVVDNFSGADYAGNLNTDLAKAGVKDTETLYDPHSKAPLGDVLVGPQYILKLTKQATTQYSARSEGKYDVNRSPLRGGDDGAKALDLLTMYAMLGHGSRANLREMATFKGTQNEPFWNALSAGAGSGMMLPPPTPTFAYKKFEAYLKGAGVNVTRDGSKKVISPMTDREVEKLSNGAVTDQLFVHAKNLKEEKGGFMDPIVFGGRKGDRWGHIDLAEPIPNPIFEQPIMRLTGLAKKQFEGLVQGKLWVNPASGQWSDVNDPDSVTGGEAVKTLLGKIDVDQQIKDWTDVAKKAKTPAILDKANKSLKYLTALKKLKISPVEAYIQTKIPIVPPQFRPVIEKEDGTLSTPGLNMLYRDMGLVNDQLKWQNGQPHIPDSVSAELRQNLYEGVKAVAGVGNPIAYYPEARRPKGIIEQIKGDPAKTGFFQHDVLSRRQNLVGRGTIIPEPKLGVDEIGLPEEMSWTVFEPFIMRRLVNTGGMSPGNASAEVKKRSMLARGALEAEMKDRPVMLNRAPSLHKFSIMALKPQMTDGKAIKIPPLIVKGMNADFDGDAVTIHVPVLHDAVEEAYNMLPSKNLYNPGTGQIMMKPQNESALGLYLLSKDPTKKQLVTDELPAPLQAKYADQVLDKKGLNSLMRDLAETLPKDHGKVVDKLKALGDDHVYRTGFTVSMKDLVPTIPEKDAIFADTHKRLAALNTQTPQGKTQAQKIIGAASTQLDAAVSKELAKQGNSFDLMVRSGARGNLNQLKQIVSSPFMVDDHHGHQSPVPITKSFSEGLPFSDYWSTLYGARATAVDKQLQTSEPGAFTKDIMATAITQVISSHDSGPQEGIDLPISGESNDLEERFLAKDIHVGSTVIARAGEQVTPSLLHTLKDRKVSMVRVMSPLTDPSPHGISAKSYGLNEKGMLPAIGDNVGALSGSALSEPLTQMTMQTFHQGGISGTRGVVAGYEKIDKLFKMHQIKGGKASLAPMDGRVDKIEDNATGGKNIHIQGSKDPVFVEQGLWDADRVRVGSQVRKGDILSKGLVQPQELLQLKGMLHAQNYIVDEIHKSYKDQGVPLKRRAVETVVRAMGNTTKIHDPGDSNFLPGDVAPWTVVNDYNNKKIGDVPVAESLGHILLDDNIPGMKKGDAITDRVKGLLERMDKKTVSVGPKQILHEPFLAGIQRIPMLRGDWMAQMGYRELAKGLVEGAATMSESDLHGYSPVPAFAYGAEFGDAPKGRSKKEGVY